MALLVTGGVICAYTSTPTSFPASLFPPVDVIKQQ